MVKEDVKDLGVYNQTVKVSLLHIPTHLTPPHSDFI